MRGAVLSIGDELTLGQRLDTNGQWLSAALVGQAVLPVEHRTVPDDRDAIADAVRELAGRCDVLLITGGLGPTDDDLTRLALGDTLAPGRPLVRDDAALAVIERWFAGRERPMPPANRRQADRPETMAIVPNPNGTAPGLRGRHPAGDEAGCLVVALPGPPAEMRPMFESAVVPHLRGVPGAACIVIGEVTAYGIGESDAAERLGDLLVRGREPTVGITASGGVLTARARARGGTAEAARAVDGALATIASAWAPYALERDAAGAPQSLTQAVGALLGERGRTLVTAESCTGGWLGRVIVDEPGSSGHYRGGWVVYHDDLKVRCLGVPASMLAADGAVSARVAAAMAKGAAEVGDADYALAITGVAGPDGGSATKPVGLVYIGLATRGDARNVVVVRRFRFRGDRTAVRDRAVKSALQMLRFELRGVDPATPLLWERPERSVAGNVGAAP